MAKSEHLDKLDDGVEAWNHWRDREHIERPDLTGADLRGRRLFIDSQGRSTRHRINLKNVGLDGADLTGADLAYADLSGASLKETNLRNVHFLEADLRHVDATAADFDGCNIIDSSLEFARLQSTRFQSADIVVSGFEGADLSRADFGMSNFLQSSLGHCILAGCDFGFARFWQTHFHGADFCGAGFASTTFADVDLSHATNLDKAIHRSGSTVGIDTFCRSRGAIPSSFLREAGVPDVFIAYAQSLAVEPIQFYSCFLSHSSKDAMFCQRLRTDLRSKDLRVWSFPEDAAWGNAVWGEIDHAIRVYDKLIIVCSAHSLTSRPVIRELDRALNREDKEHREIVFPVKLDDYLFRSWDHPRRDDLLSRVVGDFTDWHTDLARYDASLQRLIGSLKRSKS